LEVGTTTKESPNMAKNANTLAINMKIIRNFAQKSTV